MSISAATQGRVPIDPSVAVKKKDDGESQQVKAKAGHTEASCYRAARGVRARRAMKLSNGRERETEKRVWGWCSVANEAACVTCGRLYTIGIRRGREDRRGEIVKVWKTCSPTRAG